MSEDWLKGCLFTVQKVLKCITRLISVFGVKLWNEIDINLKTPLVWKDCFPLDFKWNNQFFFFFMVDSQPETDLELNIDERIYAFSFYPSPITLMVGWLKISLIVCILADMCININQKPKIALKLMVILQHICLEMGWLLCIENGRLNKWMHMSTSFWDPKFSVLTKMESQHIEHDLGQCPAFA